MLVAALSLGVELLVFEQDRLGKMVFFERADTLLLVRVYRKSALDIELVDRHFLRFVLIVVFNGNVTHGLANWLLPQLLLRLLVAAVVTSIAARCASAYR